MVDRLSLLASSKPVLVIGGGGFIGRHVISALESTGIKTRVMDFSSPGPEDVGLEWITGSISDSTLVASAADGCRAVIFLANASLPGSSQGDMAREAIGHVGMTLQVAEICKDIKVNTFLFASSGGTVYGFDAPHDGLIEEGPTRPLNGYGVSKLSIEHYLRLMNSQGAMRTISFRISNPYGEGQRAHRAQGIIAAAMQHAIAGTPIPIWGDGSIERDFVHVEDVASAFVAGLDYDGSFNVINIGSGHGRTVNEVLKAAQLHTGRTLSIDYQPNRRIDVHRNVLSIARAKEELSWFPKVGFDEGIARTARWWCAQNI